MHRLVLLTPVLENTIISIKTGETEGSSDMAGSYDVAVRVVSQKGTCGSGHKVGDEWIIKGKTPAGICLSAFNSLFLSAQTLRYGGTFPWESNPDVATIACPDAGNPVVLELRRLRK